MSQPGTCTCKGVSGMPNDGEELPKSCQCSVKCSGCGPHVENTVKPPVQSNVIDVPRCQASVFKINSIFQQKASLLRELAGKVALKTKEAQIASAIENGVGALVSLIALPFAISGCGGEEKAVHCARNDCPDGLCYHDEKWQEICGCEPPEYKTTCNDTSSCDEKGCHGRNTAYACCSGSKTMEESFPKEPGNSKY